MPKTVAVWVIAVVGALLALGCGNAGAPVSTESVATDSAAIGVVLQHDFEDGTAQGWIPRGAVTLTNTTEAAADGTHSLKTTGRTAGFHGPSLNVLPLITRGASYQISVKARLVGGEAATTVRVTVQQTAPGGANSFFTVAQNTNVTDGAWVTLTGTFSYNVDVTALLLYVEATSATASYFIDTFVVTETAPAPAVNLQHGWEDGTLQGWIPRGAVVLTNVSDQAADGARSLLTTNRTAGFHGPSLNLLGVLRKGATYQMSVKGRMFAGSAVSTLRVTMQRTPTGGATAFDTLAQNTAVTDGAWVTMSGLYSFATDVTELLLYVESPTATASYYIDSFVFTEVAPPAGPPGNTNGAAASFESNTTEGWFSRTTLETVAVSSADAHSGTSSLLTSGRTQPFQGPAFDVTNVMFNGSRYRIMVWVKLAAGQADTQVRLSLERRLGTQPSTFHTVVGNTTVTAGAWVRLAATYDMALANSSVTMYLETNSGAPLSSFYMDDFSIAFVTPPTAERDIPSVYQTLAGSFRVGAAIHAGDLGGEHAFLLTKHFNSVTSENDMKWSSLQPTEGTFTYAAADAQLAFAKANGMHMRGHTLVWHVQTPAWVFNDGSGNPLTPTPENKALLLARLENHIRAVVMHFGADIYAWDVVNEAIDESQPDGFRRSPWFNVIGPEYIDRAFIVAREVAPNAELYINDFNTTITSKRSFLYDLVRDLRLRGVPVDGVGHQMHNNVEFPSPASITQTIDLFHALGVKNEVTELDVSIYSNSLPGPIVDYFDIPASRLVQQGYSYRNFFNAFRQLTGKVQSVTFWGQADDHTWLASATRTDAPLLFDLSLKKKHAYWGVIDPNQLPGADVTTSVVAGSGAMAGQSIPFAITVANDGDEDLASYLPLDDDLPAANVTLVSAIPPGSVFESLVAPAGWTCTTPPAGSGGTVTCTRESLDVNASEAFTLNVAAACAVPNGSQIVDAASASSTTADPNLTPNNAASAAVTIANPPPIVTLAGPADVMLECGSAFSDPGAIAIDACEGPVGVSVTGAVNPNQVGRYVLSYDATDLAGGHGSATRNVAVVDTTAPVLDLTDLIVLLPGIKIIINGQTITINGQTFPLQQKTVKLLGTTITFNGSSITINGQTFTVDGRVLMLLLPLHQYQAFTVAELVAALGADCDTSLDRSDVVIERVTSDELENAPGGGDGNTAADILLGGDCRSVQLRAERDSNGNGRVYTVTLRVRDASGNTTARDVKVLVPKNHGIGSSVDDGPRYTVNGSCQ